MAEVIARTFVRLTDDPDGGIPAEPGIEPAVRRLCEEQMQIAIPGFHYRFRRFLTSGITGNYLGAVFDQLRVGG